MPTPPTDSTQAAAGVLLASLVLPGLAALAGMAPAIAAAENVPEKTTIAVQYGTYTDGQPGWERVTTQSPQVYVQAPIAGEWAIEATGVVDAISGATPRWHTQHTQISGASQMSDVRRAGEVRVTRYLARAAVSASVARSSENDYTSNAWGLDARWSPDDNNRTWTVGAGRSHDTIDTQSSDGGVIDQHKTSSEFMLGLTQVLTPNDTAQLQLTRSLGSGYYSDPYRTFDRRPDQRDAWIALVRWNHYVDPLDATVRSSYRYYSDTFGLQSHTLGVDWIQPVGRWTLAPGMRYYSQSAAYFYLDPILDAHGDYDQTAVVTRAIRLFGSSQSTDQRLAAFGALTVSVKLSYAWTPDTMASVTLAAYRQTAGWHLGGEGSPNLDPFKANFVQIGVTHRF